MNRFKRWATLTALAASFFIFIIGLTSCGLLESADDGLTNAIGSQENGPGSGKWNPPTPNSDEQCQQMYNVLVALKENTEEKISNIERVRRRCVDEEGKFRPDVNEEACIEQFNQIEVTINDYMRDFFVGVPPYADTCTGEASKYGPHKDPPKPPEPPEPEPEPAPKDPPETEDPEDDDWPCCYCLTCTHSLDIEVVTVPFRIDQEVP